MKSEQEDETPWRPIAEAPKDGTVVLIAFSDGTVTQAEFGEYACESKRYVGWYFYNCDEDQWYSVGFHGRDQPTHFMPLPKPPRDV